MPKGIWKNGKKPIPPLRKGSHLTLEQRNKIKEGLKGHFTSIETRKKIGLSNSIALKGKKYPNRKKPKPFSLQHKNNMKGRIPWNKGIKSLLSGENHPNWQGGITPINYKLRNSLEYKLWRKSVFERDNYTCIWCGTRSGNGKTIILNADHIKPFALFPELRFAIDNGRTLCKECHRKTDTYGGKTKC